MSNVATNARYWSSSFYSSPTYYLSYSLNFFYNGTVYPNDSGSGSGNRSFGFTLRCVQE